MRRPSATEPLAQQAYRENSSSFKTTVAAEGSFIPPAPPSAPPEGGTPKEQSDYKRGHSISLKRLFLAFLVEFGVVITSLIAAWIYAEEYGHDLKTKIMMMLAPFAYALVEFSRVPLAVTTRAHPSLLMRVVALFAVLGAAGVTVKSMSQLGQFQFQPRLNEVVEKRGELIEAKNNKAHIDERIQTAKENVATAKGVYDEAQRRATSASNDVTKLPPPPPCRTVTTTRRDGTVVRSLKCPPADTRTRPMIGNLVTASDAISIAKKDFAAAQQRLTALDPAAADHSVTAAEISYRHAIHNSQLHSFAGMLFGKDGAEVTDGEINTFLRIFVFGGAILVSLSSTLLAMTAVVRIKKKPVSKKQPIEMPDAGLIDLLKPMYQEAKKTIAKEAAKDLAGDLKKKFGSAAGSASSSTDTSDSRPVPEDAEVIVDLVRKREHNDVTRQHV